MLFIQHTKFVLQNYDVVKECIRRLAPADRRHNFDLKPTCLTWSCSDFENFPFVLEIVPFVKKTGKIESELKNGCYYLKKAQNHDHSPETLVEPSNRNQSVSQYHILEEEYNYAEREINELENRLKKTIMKERR